MKNIEKSSHLSESNILHKCKKCKRLITTESIILNYQKIEGALFNDVKIQKGEFIFFINDSNESLKKISNKLEYTLSNIKSKILCKKCEIVIGYFKFHTGKSKIVGILQSDYILSEPIEMKKSSPTSESEKPQILFVNKMIIEHKINIQNVKTTNEIMSSFIKDFYRIEMNSALQIIQNTDKKIQNSNELLGLQVEYEESSKMNK